MKIHLVAGARPNFMKVAPLYHEFRKHPWAEVSLVHTGQHYDTLMSDVFFSDLGLPVPDIALEVGSSNHAQQTAAIMTSYDRVLDSCEVDWVIVVGDVNSTLACALVAAKRGIRVAHLEAGLRSFDRSMPEELNRELTDRLADLLWTPSADASDNLLREGIPEERIDFVGNVMIDALEMIRAAGVPSELPTGFAFEVKRFALVTMHRPSNVDDLQSLESLCDLTLKVATRLPLCFPLHPRTKSRLRDANLLSRLETCPEVHLCEPLPYPKFISLMESSAFVLTDSGGIQEESSYLGVPCLTLRENTERPVTVSHGTNRLVRIDSVLGHIEQILNGSFPKGQTIPLWDGRAAERVVASLRTHSIQP